MDDLENGLSEFTGDEGFATDFFARYVRGREVPDYEALLANAGFQLRRARPAEVWLGTTGLRYASGGATLSATPPIGSPLYEAGIGRRDRIVSIDGQAITGAAVLREIVGRHSRGDTVQVRFEQRGRTRTVTVTFAVNPQLEVVKYEEAGLEMTEEMREFRRRWLGEN